jgi:hypothetical protein
MNIVPPMTENGAPTIIIDTTDAAMKAEGLVPPAQSEVVAQLPPIESRKLTRPSIKKSVIYAEPVSQTPHTGGGADLYGVNQHTGGGADEEVAYESYGAPAKEEDGTRSTDTFTGGAIKVVKLG